jgi:hypothetical protein
MVGIPSPSCELWREVVTLIAHFSTQILKNGMRGAELAKQNIGSNMAQNSLGMFVPQN